MLDCILITFLCFSLSFSWTVKTNLVYYNSPFEATKIIHKDYLHVCAYIITSFDIFDLTSLLLWSNSSLSSITFSSKLSFLHQTSHLLHISKHKLLSSTVLILYLISAMFIPYSMEGNINFSLTTVIFISM